MFLLPIVITFYYLSKKFIAKQEYIPYVISKNILYISSIPLIISIVSGIWKYIPHVFISNLINFFYNLNIPFFLYYILIFICIIIIYYAVTKLQIREKRKTKNKIKFSNSSYINNNKCCNCENKVDYKYMKFCPHCNNKLTRECNSCNKETIKDLPHCIHCEE